MQISITIPAESEIVRSVFERNEISATIFNVTQEVKSSEHYKKMGSEMGMCPNRLKVHLEKKKRVLTAELSRIEQSVLKYKELWMDKFVHIQARIKAL